MPSDVPRHDPAAVTTAPPPTTFATPQAALRLYRATFDDLTTLDELVALTSADPGIAAEVLRVANSARFVRGDGVRSLREALVVVGLRVVRRIALGVGARETTSRLGLPAALLEAFWWQSSVRAATCATLARGLGVNEDEAFSIGLLQDLGLLILLHEQPDRVAGWPWLFQVDVDARRSLELEFFHDDHARRFAVVAHAWGLPQNIVDAVCAHHDAERLATLPAATAVHARLAAVADVVAAMPVHDPGDEAMHAAIAQLGLRDASATLHELPRCCDETAIALGLTRPTLDVDGLARAALRELVERGQREALRLIALERSIEERLVADEASKRAQAELWKKAYTDPLTGLGNRRAFDEAFERLLSECRRDGLPLSLLVFDVDHFKLVNDRFGHDAGDAVLRAIGAVLVRHTRASDVRARIGGEEFVVLLPGAGEAVGERIAEKIRATTAELNVQHEQHALAVTISAGGRTIPAVGDDLPAAALRAFREADAALYLSKRRGRDRVTWACDDGPSVRGRAPLAQSANM